MAVILSGAVRAAMDKAGKQLMEQMLEPNANDLYRDLPFEPTEAGDPLVYANSPAGTAKSFWDSNHLQLHQPMTVVAGQLVTIWIGDERIQATAPRAGTVYGYNRLLEALIYDRMGMPAPRHGVETPAEDHW